MLEIEDAIDVNIYRYNGFRLLDLPITASGKKVKKSFRKIEARHKMSKGDEMTPNENALMPITPSPEFSSYQKANGRLANAQIRFIDEIFWFWPANIAKDEDALAWQYLRQKNYEDFIRYWKDKNDYNVSYHNLAVFYQAMSLDLYALNKDRSEIIYYSKEALYYWRKTFQSGFEDFVKERVEMSKNPLLKESFVEYVFSNLQKAILSIYMDMTLDAIRTRSLDEVKSYFGLIKNSGFDFEAVTYAINTLLTFIIDQIDAEIKDFTSSAENLEKSDYLMLILSAKSYTLNVSPLLEILLAIAHNNIKAKDAITKANSVIQKKVVDSYNNLLNDFGLFHNLNLLYVSLFDVISVRFAEFEINPRSKKILENNSELTQKRINQLESSVYSSSDKAVIELTRTFLADEFEKGPNLNDIIINMKMISRSGASDEISEVSAEILTDSLNRCLQAEDRATQKLYRQNLNMLKYQSILEGV